VFVPHIVNHRSLYLLLYIIGHPLQSSISVHLVFRIFYVVFSGVELIRINVQSRWTTQLSHWTSGSGLLHKSSQRGQVICMLNPHTAMALAFLKPLLEQRRFRAHHHSFILEGGITCHAREWLKIKIPPMRQNLLWIPRWKEAYSYQYRVQVAHRLCFFCSESAMKSDKPYFLI
jgi:hypothetical protein